MKAKFILLLLIPALIGFSEKSSEQQYTYLLTVSSTDGQEHGFNMVITSKEINQTEAVKTSLENQTTPFERNLPPGEHTIIVTHIGEKGFINTHVVGILNNTRRGGASSDDSGAILQAGPGGRYAVDQK